VLADGARQEAATDGVPLVFSGERLWALRDFLGREERRRVQAEERNVRFVPLADEEVFT
jgi:hypothetical protein